jgi:NADH-quinone oxidoreductase subunit J
MSQQLIFYAFAGLIAFCSVMVISVRNPVTAAIYLVVDLFLMAGIYAILEAHFVAAIQILVYAGAITVLFLFVIMLIDLRDDELKRPRLSSLEYLTMFLTALGFAALGVMFASAGEPAVEAGSFTPDSIEAAGGNTYVVGMMLFTKYLWPFELASILILLAMVAAIVIAKKDAKPSKAVKPGRPAHGTR